MPHLCPSLCSTSLAMQCIGIFQLWKKGQRIMFFQLLTVRKPNCSNFSSVVYKNIYLNQYFSMRLMLIPTDVLPVGKTHLLICNGVMTIEQQVLGYLPLRLKTVESKIELQAQMSIPIYRYLLLWHVAI